jgi:hypothetical protein
MVHMIHFLPFLTNVLLDQTLPSRKEFLAAGYEIAHCALHLYVDAETIHSNSPDELSTTHCFDPPAGNFLLETEV